VVVSLNHRLAPSVTISHQLIDVKRAIRWVKENISKFGGDPGFVSITGSCSGGHLAIMAAMTMNDPLYQVLMLKERLIALHVFCSLDLKVLILLFKRVVLLLGFTI